MIRFLIIMFCLNTKVSVEGLRYFKFKMAPALSGPDGIKCAIEHYDNRVARGSRIDPQTGTCDRLTDSWFSNQIREDNYYYFKLLMAENAFSPKRVVYSDLPYHFMDGSSIVFYIKIGAISYGRGSELVFNINSKYGQCLQANTRFWNTNIVFNHNHNGRWGRQIVRYLPFGKSYTTYKVEIRMTAYGFYVYLDDHKSPFQVFKHRVSRSLCTGVELRSGLGSAVYERLQFYYPV